MPFNFPPNPSVGATAINPNTNLGYVWNGTTWKIDPQLYSFTNEAFYVPATAGTFQARYNSKALASLTPSVVTWDIIDFNLIGGLSYNTISGVFTNTSGGVLKLTFNYQCLFYTPTIISFGNGGVLETAIWFSLNSDDNNRQNRYGSQSLPFRVWQRQNLGPAVTNTTQTSWNTLATKWTFILNPSDTVRCYMWSKATTSVSVGNGAYNKYYDETNAANYSTRLYITQDR